MITLPTYAKNVMIVMTHHIRRGQASPSVSWRKKARKQAFTLHKQLQKSIVDANWYLR